MNIGKVLERSAVGILAWVTNELRVYALNNDQAKLRVGAPGDHGGCLSINKVWVDSGEPSHEEELGLIQIKQDERTRNDPHGTRAELTIHLNNGNLSVTEDKRMVPVMLIRTDGYTMLVPNNPHPDHGPDNPIAQPSGSYDGIQFEGSEGKFFYARQRDGHDVLYSRATNLPIWVSDGGPNGMWLG